MPLGQGRVPTRCACPTSRLYARVAAADAAPIWALMSKVTINGEAREVADGASIAVMLTAIGIDPTKVAVERNLEIVPRSTLAEVVVADGDQYEIVHFVGGG